jgi:DNA-binding transcriptional regulator YdaS (Cro superfamily)
MEKFLEFIDSCGSSLEAANKLGMSVQMISHIRKGRRKVSFATAREIESITSGRISRKDLRPDIYG